MGHSLLSPYYTFIHELAVHLPLLSHHNLPQGSKGSILFCLLPYPQVPGGALGVEQMMLLVCQALYNPLLDLWSSGYRHLNMIAKEDL